MKSRILILAVLAAAAAVATATAALAGDRRSNVITDRQSHNGYVRERIDDTYCVDGYCERIVTRRAYREGLPRWREARRYRHDRGDDRHTYHRSWRDDDRNYRGRRSGDDDDDD